MLAVLTVLPVAAFSGCILAAALSDARTLRISNRLNVSILGLFGVYATIALTPVATALALALAGLTLVVAFIGYSRGLMGGGDAKLIAACMAWAGPSHAIEFLIVTGLAGGVIAFALTSPLTARAAHSVRRSWPMTAAEGAASMPYGVAIATGAAAVVFELLAS